MVGITGEVELVNRLVRTRKELSKPAIFAIIFQLCEAVLVTTEASFKYVDSIGFADVEQTFGSKTPVTIIGDTTFSIYRQSETWSRAKEICQSNNQLLGFFLTEKEYDDVAQKIYSISEKTSKPNDMVEFRINRRYWIGLNDNIEKNGIWKWAGLNLKNQGKSTRIEKFHKWTSGKKPENTTEEHCTVMWNPMRRKFHMWKAVKCTNKYYFICRELEKDIEYKENFVQNI